MLPKVLNELLENNKWEEAIAFLNDTNIQLTDEELSAKAWCYSRVGNYEEAINLYSQMIHRQPQIAKWHYAKGYQFYMQKKWQEAIDNFNEALKLFDEYFIVKYRIAYAYIQLSGNIMQWSKETFWKAIDHLEDCHKIFKSYSEEEQKNRSSTYADICALHGKTIMASQKYLDKSICLLKKAISLKNDDDFRYQLAKAYYSNKQNTEALKVIPNSSKSFYISELRSQILSENGDYAESNKILFGLIKFRRKDYLYRRISNNFLNLIDFDKAEEFIKKAISIDRRNYKNYLVYGLVLKEKMMYKSAIENFEKARKIKQDKYQLDCVEAITHIEMIQTLTNGAPTDLDTNYVSYESSKHLGKIVIYKKDKGYGFISEGTTNNNVFFHISSFELGNPRIGDEVEFDIEETPKGKKAININCR